MGQFKMIGAAVTKLEEKLTGMEKSLRRLEDSIPKVIKWEILLDRLHSYTRPINGLYQRFRKYQNTPMIKKKQSYRKYMRKSMCFRGGQYRHD